MQKAREKHHVSMPNLAVSYKLVRINEHEYNSTSITRVHL